MGKTLRTRRRVALTLGAAIVTAGVAAEARAQAGDPVKIGLMHDLSGPIATFGTFISNGAKLAVEEFNARGGVLGRKIEIVSEDTASNHQLAAGAIRSLASKGVVAVHGPTASTAVVVAAAAAKQQGIALVVPSAAESFADGSLPDSVFRVSPDAALAMPAALTEFQRITPFERLGIVYSPQNGSSASEARLLRAIAAEPNAKFKIVADEAVENGTTDFSGVLSSLVRKDPQLVFTALLVQESAAFLKQAKERNLPMRFAGGPVSSNVRVFELAGPAGNGYLLYLGFTEASTDPAVASFVDRYTKAYGRRPETFGAQGYSAMIALLTAIERAKTTDHEAIRKSLSTLDIGGTPIGTIKFSPQGARPWNNIASKAVIIEVKDGQFTAVK